VSSVIWDKWSKCITVTFSISETSSPTFFGTDRYPTHTVVDLRGNVNSRIQKLKDNDWNGAIFAAAGLDRIGLEYENTIGLTWMVPAPAQGAIMIVAMENDDFVREACSELNHEATEICTKIEREFLRLLEGGCTAPIGALAYINNKEEVTLKGVLLSVDGKKKLEAEFTAPLGEHTKMGNDCANSILSRGGKRLMSEIQSLNVKTTIFSTKNLTQAQKHLFLDGIQVKSEDFVKTAPNRIPQNILKSKIQNVVITSKNAVEALLTNVSAAELQFKNIYCVGRRTKRLIEERIGKVQHSENNAKKLAEYLVDFIEGTEVTYFCSNIRMDDLPKILEENKITSKLGNLIILFIVLFVLIIGGWTIVSDRQNLKEQANNACQQEYNFTCPAKLAWRTNNPNIHRIECCTGGYITLETK